MRCSGCNISGAIYIDAAASALAAAAERERERERERGTLSKKLACMAGRSWQEDKVSQKK
jgi:hypothetical protein